MTEDGLFERLRAYLLKLDGDARLIDPAWAPLTDVIQAYPAGPRPTGAYASLNVLADRGLAEVDCETYEARTIQGEPRVIAARARAVEWLVRVEVYASRPTDRLDLFRAALRSQHALVDLSPLVVRQVGRTPRMPEQVQQHFEGRAHFDVALAGIVVSRLLVDVIDSGSITLTAANRAALTTALAYAR